jgi:hypothetical protein
MDHQVNHRIFQRLDPAKFVFAVSWEVFDMLVFCSLAIKSAAASAAAFPALSPVLFDTNSSNIHAVNQARIFAHFLDAPFSRRPPSQEFLLLLHKLLRDDIDMQC